MGFPLNRPETVPFGSKITIDVFLRPGWPGRIMLMETSSSMRTQFAQLLAEVGGYPVRISKTTVTFWREGTEMPRPAARRAIVRVLAVIQPLEHPRQPGHRLSDEELDEAVVAEVHRDRGLPKSQVGRSLPRGAIQRRLAAVGRMAKAGRVVGRLGPARPDATGRAYERLCYWPPAKSGDDTTRIDLNTCRQAHRASNTP